jgi:hypothetical protein
LGIIIAAIVDFFMPGILEGLATSFLILLAGTIVVGILTGVALLIKYLCGVDKP